MPSVLIIDDDESLRDALRRILHKEGYGIIEAGEGKQGLKQLECRPVDLVLLDMFMPEKDGLETIGEIRRTHPGMRIVAMSGGAFHGSIDVLHVAKQLGIQRTLLKPFTQEQLLEALREELGT